MVIYFYGFPQNCKDGLNCTSRFHHFLEAFLKWGSFLRHLDGCLPAGTNRKVAPTAWRASPGLAWPLGYWTGGGTGGGGEASVQPLSWGFWLGSGLPWWFRWYRICLQWERPGFDPWVGEMPWRREWLPTRVFLPGESHGQRSLGGYSPQHSKESDTTERLSLSLHFWSGSNLPTPMRKHQAITVLARMP